MDGRACDLTIGELAAESGKSVHTIRYYDDEGLIPAVSRTASGHRRFSARHVHWLGLLDRLRASGMSIGRMRQYARLARSGDDTVAERLELLKAHEAAVRSRIEELQGCLAIVRAKIGLYEGTIDDPNAVWALVAATDRAGRRPDGLRGP